MNVLTDKILAELMGERGAISEVRAASERISFPQFVRIHVLFIQNQLIGFTT